MLREDVGSVEQSLQLLPPQRILGFRKHVTPFGVDVSSELILLCCIRPDQQMADPFHFPADLIGSSTDPTVGSVFRMM